MAPHTNQERASPSELTHDDEVLQTEVPLVNPFNYTADVSDVWQHEFDRFLYQLVRTSHIEVTSPDLSQCLVLICAGAITRASTCC